MTYPRQPVLGWQVTPGLDPRYWLNTDPKPGAHDSNDIVTVPNDKIARHTAIIAQSGSGKSFFLGRLVEEILVATKARCVIFDPNADFLRAYEVEGEELWSDASYDPLKRVGKLPHEASRDIFLTEWDQITKKILTTPREAARSHGPLHAIKVPLTALSVEFLTGDVTPSLRAQIEHCHSFVRALSDILELRCQLEGQRSNLLEEAEDLLSKSCRLTDNQLAEEFRKVSILPQVDLDKEYAGYFPFLETSIPGDAKKELADVIITQSRERMDISRRYADEKAITYYFARARQYDASGLLKSETSGQDEVTRGKDRLVVVDLPALDKGSRLLAVNALLTQEWEHARNAWSSALRKPPEEDMRVPTILVVDEAHNLIPKEAPTLELQRIRDQFRTIIAEGRKFGLFLLLVTQRPDKLDPSVLGECQNKAILRLSASSVLEMTKRLLNLDDLPPQMVERTLSFETGRVLLSGDWAEGRPQMLYSAARRTVEGGRDLQAAHWSVR